MLHGYGTQSAYTTVEQLKRMLPVEMRQDIGTRAAKEKRKD